MRCKYFLTGREPDKSEAGAFPGRRPSYGVAQLMERSPRSPAPLKLAVSREPRSRPDCCTPSHASRRHLYHSKLQFNHTKVSIKIPFVYLKCSFHTWFVEIRQEIAVGWVALSEVLRPWGCNAQHPLAMLIWNSRVPSAETLCFASFALFRVPPASCNYHFIFDLRR